MNCRFSPFRVKLIGSGHALPGEPVSNRELLAALAAHCGAAAARRGRRIAKRLGIESRYLSRSLQQRDGGTQTGVEAPQLSASAVRQALENGAADTADIGYLVGHTTTPHTLLPSGVAWTADELDYSGPFLELRQACTGFAHGLQIAAAMIQSGSHTPVAVVGCETGSSYFRLAPDFLDLEQLINYVQMGDGAGAAVLGPDDGSERQILSDMFVGQAGLNREPGFYLQGGGSNAPQQAHGFPVFRHRVGQVRQHGPELFEKGIAAIRSRGYELTDFDWILPHQANGHLAAQFSEALAIPADKVYVTADRLGNLGSAAIWVSFDQLRRSGRLRTGDRVLVLGAEATKFLFGGFVYRH